MTVARPRSGRWSDVEVPADASALSDVLNRLSRLADDHPELMELDLNPVIGLPDRAVIVDARIRVARPRLRTDAKSW